jgi:hypothetical protein
MPYAPKWEQQERERKRERERAEISKNCSGSYCCWPCSSNGDDFSGTQKELDITRCRKNQKSGTTDPMVKNGWSYSLCPPCHFDTPAAFTLDERAPVQILVISKPNFTTFKLHKTIV